MRVLPTGEVVSDSHNFRKNEAAARLIEKELKLNTPVRQPNPTAPGDRQALQTAEHRAERQGTPRISAKAVREVVSEAKSRSDLIGLLASKQNIESVFETRGKGKDERIFGWKMRVIGSEEWIKASTLAKDLSWPKIAHRFENDSDAARIASQLTATLPVLTHLSSKMPEMLKSLTLPQQYSAKENKPFASHQTEVLDVPTFDLKPIQTLPIGPLSKVMVMLGFACINLSLAAFRSILNFVAAIMRRFGFNMKVADEQPNASIKHQLPLYYYPTQQAIPAPSVEHKAATELFRIVAAVENNSPDDLPVIAGTEHERGEALAALKNEDQESGSSAAVDVDLPRGDFGFKIENISSIPETIQYPKTDPLDDLKSAIAVDEIAAKAVKDAEIDRPGMYVYFDETEKCRADVNRVQNLLEKAKQNLEEWRVTNRFKARFGRNSKNELFARVEYLEAEEKLARQDLADAQTADEKATKFYYSLPKGVVPATTMAAWVNSREAVRTSREAVQAEAELLLNQLQVDPMLGRQLTEIRRQIESGYKNYLATQTVTASYFQSLTAQIRVLRKLAAQAAAGGGGGNGDDDEHKPEEEKFA